MPNYFPTHIKSKDVSTTDTPTLIMTVGLPRSGKTTWAKSSGFPVVNIDAIRLVTYGEVFIAEFESAIWATAKVMVKSLFVYGYSTVVLDACNITIFRRDEWIDSMWARSYALFKADSSICIQRAEEEKKFDLVTVIKRMASYMEWPE